ncbi:MAG TPA: ribonucleotide-diphosphate reductase subunit beta [Solirubrobacteraceae bacterium]|nr:ribonucleotide-diphosphate reductase subunit beta [Solirubrobacteraceae bacterium]
MSTDVHLNDPQTLYRHWEGEQWSPWDVELDTDREQWRGSLSDQDKGLVYWALSSLMVAEERITTKFAGLVMAGDSEEETTFLATQQVDEARHMQFYARFRDEVVAEPQTIAAHVARSREELGDSFEVIFDQALVQAHERLASNPRDAGAKVEFVTIYHLLIEATLGLTAFEFITRYLRDNDLLPGFVEGYTNIHHDEQRHIGYGIWFLRKSVGRDPELADRVRQTLRDLLSPVAAALAPPDREGTDWEALGASGDEIRDFALNGLTRRLNIVGVPLTSL